MTAIARLDLAHLAVSAGGFQIPVAFSRDVSERAAPAIKCAPYFALSPPFKQIPRIGFQESDVKRIFTQKNTGEEGGGGTGEEKRVKLFAFFPHRFSRGNKYKLKQAQQASLPSVKLRVLQRCKTGFLKQDPGRARHNNEAKTNFSQPPTNHFLLLCIRALIQLLKPHR